MATEFRAPSVLLAIALFSIVTAVGQRNTGTSRMVAANVRSADQPVRTRLPSRVLPSNATEKLPFEKTVTIYYSGPKKNATAPAIGRANGSTAGPAISERARPGTKQTPVPKASSSPPTAKYSVSVKAPATAALQPILIYYKTYNSVATETSQSRPSVKPGPKIAGLSERNETAAVPLQGKPTTPISPSDSLRDWQEQTSEITRGYEASSAISDSGSNVAPAAAPGPQTQTTTDARAPAVSVGSVNHQPLVASETVPILGAVDKNEEGSTATDTGPTGSPPNKEEDTTRQNSISPVAPGPATTAPLISQAEIASSLNPGSPVTALPVVEERETASVEAVDLNNSAVQLTLEKQYAEAKTLLQRAIEAQPGVAKFHRNLSIVFERMKMTDEAVAAARTAEKLSPTDASVVEQRCALELHTGNSPAAVDCYERLNSIQPLDGLSQTFYGIGLFGSGKLNESIAVLEKAASSTPPIPVAINALGLAYYNKKRLTDAATAFKNAVELAPETFEFRYNLAIAHLSLRNKAGAISQYNILKGGNPELANRLFRILFSDKVVVVPKN